MNAQQDPPIRKPAPRRLMAVAAAAAAALIVAVAAFVLAGGDAARSVDGAALALARARALEAQVDLAGSERLYLLLEPDRGRLTLHQGAAPLRAWHVAMVAAGARRVPLGRGSSRDDWKSVLWEDARLDPPVRRERREIVSDQVEPPDLTGAVEWIPPTPDEEVPTPERFIVHFSGGLGLEVRAPGADTLTHRPGLLVRVGSSMRRLAPSNWDRYRVRVTMDPTDAGSLYRSLPEGVAFLAVLPED